MANIRVGALGGLDEDGKTLNILEIDGDIFVVDCGLKYPNNSELLGVEFIIPDFTYLIDNKDRLKGVFITHGHDDVVGALPYLLDVVDTEIYATALTAKIIELVLERHGNKNKKVNVIDRAGSVTVAGHIVHSFPLMQSIADAIGLSFETENGQVIYSSEFIVDYDFMNESFMMNINSLSQMGSHNVLALFSESVGAKRQGYTSPNHRISSIVEPYFESNERRLILTLYKQNLFRIIEILELAKKYNKQVFFLDNEHVKMLNYVNDFGYYEIPRGLIVNKNDFDNNQKNIVVIVSGSGHDVFRNMNRIAVRDDKLVQLQKDDVVVIASPVVPGTEKDAAKTEDELYKAGVEVHKISAKEVLSMHASAEDLKMMINLMRPRYYIPLKGEYADLVANAEIAIQMGYTPDRVVILDNGQFAEFNDGLLTSTHDTIELNDTFISGADKSEMTGMVIKERENLSTDGVIVLGVVLDFKSKELIGGPDVQSRGVIYLKDADYILDEVSNILIETIQEMVKGDYYDNTKARQEAREKISKYILKQTGKKPMILPAIVEINTSEDVNG